ncbi:MAG: hypothetical protein ACYTF6_14910 [Planctomycetota bacterium]
MACEECGGRYKRIALIKEPAAVHAICQHLGFPNALPRPEPARPPPQLDFDDHWA